MSVSAGARGSGRRGGSNNSSHLNLYRHCHRVPSRMYRRAREPQTAATKARRDRHASWPSMCF